MNHAHSHLHDPFSLVRRQITFGLVSTLIFFVLVVDRRKTLKSRLNPFRLVRKRWFTQRSAWSAHGWKESRQPRVVRAKSNERTRAHIDAEDSSAANRVGGYLRWARLESDSTGDVNQLSRYGAEEYYDCNECCWRHSPTSNGNLFESHFECKRRGEFLIDWHIWWNIHRKEINTNWFVGPELSQCLHFYWCSVLFCSSASLVILVALWFCSPFVDSSLSLALGWCRESISPCPLPLVTCALTRLNIWSLNRHPACRLTFFCTTLNARASDRIHLHSVWGNLKRQSAALATRWIPSRKFRSLFSRSSLSPSSARWFPISTQVKDYWQVIN